MMDEKSHNQLLTDLASADSKIRCRAALELGRRGDPACIDVLTQSLVTRDYSCGLYEAVEILGQFRDERIVAALIESMFGTGIISLFSIAPLLKTRHPRGIEAVIDMMGNRSPIMSLTAAGLIAELGTPLTKRLLVVITDDNPRRRSMAAYALGKIGSEAAVESLITALDDEDDSVRSRAAAALGHIGDERALPALVVALQDPDWETRNCAAESLLKLGYTPRTALLDVLLANLQDNSSGVRIETMHPLERVADPYTIPALIHAMKTDEHRGVRLYAAQALGAIGDVSAVPDLLGSLDDEDELVQQAVRAALEKLGHASGGIAP